MQILFSKLPNISNSTKDKTNEFYEWILYLMNFRLSLYFLRIEILRTFASKENGPIISRIRSSDPREISKATTLFLSFLNFL